jgi:hypothetical protein
MWVAFNDRARAAASKQRSIGTAALAGVALAAAILTPSGASAQCTDTFSYFFKNGATNAPLQYAVPLGVGSSLNALMTTMNTVNTAFLSPSSSFVSARGGAQADQLGGGVWGRAVTGTVDSQATTTAKIDFAYAKITFIEPLPTPHFETGKLPASVIDPSLQAGTGTCKGKLNENYSGYQFGFDLARLNAGGEGANFHLGVTAGLFDSKTKDTTAANSYTKTFQYQGEGPVSDTINSPAGSFGADSKVPFIGLYATYTNGNFFADALVRQDFYLMTFNDPLNGLKDYAHNAYGFTTSANVGYKIPLPGNWFIEPSGGGLWSRVKVDDIQSPGGAFFSAKNAGTVKIDDIESFLGRASLRVGTTFNTGEVAWQPFVTGTVFHEFANNVKATSSVAGAGVDVATNCGADPTKNCEVPANGWDWHSLNITDVSTSTSRIGTFAQYGIGTAVVFGNSGWLGYGRFDYRTGENVEAYSVNGGVRYNW